jgi:hypothetical protein
MQQRRVHFQPHPNIIPT